MAEASPEPIVLLLQSDGGERLLAELDEEEHPIEEVREALTLYLGVVRESLTWLCQLPEFSHVSFSEINDCPERSPICLGAGTPEAGPDGQVQQAANVRPVLDIQALLTARSHCSDAFGDKITCDEEGIFRIEDTKLDNKVDRILKAFKPAERMQAALSEEQEQVLVDALESLCPPAEEEEEEEEEGEEGEKEPKEKESTVPVHPADLLILLAAYMYEVVGEVPQRSHPFQKLGALIGGLLGGGVRRLRHVRKVVWKVEDVVVGGARLAGTVARRSVRPLLLGFMLKRVLQTLDHSRSPAMRMARMNPAEQLEYHFCTLLGDDWKQQMEQDFLDSVKEVQEGYMTDDYNDEKRKMTAAMLRRLEIEDWDKERMKHFYYGSYGLGSWYFDMEDRLHNPYFIGARGWNGPIEQWVNKNKRYADDIPASNVDFRSAALDLIETQKDVTLTPEQRQRVLNRNRVNHTDLILSSDILTRVVDKAKLRQALS